MTTLIKSIRTQQALHPKWMRDEFLEPLFVVLTLLGIVLGELLPLMNVSPMLHLFVHLATYFFGGYYAVLAIIEALREKKIEVDLLMVLAALGAAYVDSWAEGGILLFLFSLSNVLQNYAMNRTRSAISSLLELRPDTVSVQRGDQLVEIDTDDALVGDIMALRPGERLALDGVIVRGSGNFDESTLTGESLPVRKGVGATVLAGALNQSGALDVRVTKRAHESTLARVIDMVSAAQERKANTQRFLDRFEQYYAMGVIAVVALFVMLVPLIFNVSWEDNFYRGMVLLTVASPCALVISVPAALLSAIANAARHGVLFKGGAYLEDLSKVDAVAFDKTGTLTFGKPDLADVLPQPGVSNTELLEAVLRAEMLSEHPIARAIVRHAEEEGLEFAEPDYFEAITGRGVRATWDGQDTLVGSQRMMEESGLTVPADMLAQLEELRNSGRSTAMLVHRGERWLGLVTVMDRERPDAAQKIAALRDAGVKHIVMLTGDAESIAKPMAERLGIDEVHAGLMPEDKLRLIEEARKRYGNVAMVGDGVNDAPALATATVGIAMGAAGTDAALESADLVLMKDDLGAIAYALKLSRRTQRIVWQNIIFALSVAATLVVLTLTIGVPLPMGVVGHEGSTILVVLNGLRLLANRE